ncbi:MAG: EboA domain-containing protein [Cyanobacteria bacterium J06621_8]
MLTNIKTTFTLLFDWLENRVADTSYQWLKQQTTIISNGGAERTFFTSYSAVSRYLGKEKLGLSTAELEMARELAEVWQSFNWTLEQVGRTLILLSLPSSDPDQYLATLDKLIAAADVEEAISFYQGLYLLPHPEKLQLRAAEGIRTNMTSVFNAVALNNPYPAQYLDELAWNQMVLKALFIGSPLTQIYGLESRNNQRLSQMLINYARERLAAKRTVTPELWSLAMVFQPEVVAQLKPKLS